MPKQRIEFFLPDAVVVPKQSFRIGKGHGYQTKKVTDNAEDLWVQMREYVPVTPLRGPLLCDYYVTYPWLKRHTTRERAKGKIWKSTAPDWEQLAKQLSDVLEGVFFKNDAQIASGVCEKWWGLEPGVRVRIEQL